MVGETAAEMGTETETAMATTGGTVCGPYKPTMVAKYVSALVLVVLPA